jgi:DNA-binding beta-propeller fold protein YncE
MYPMTKDEKLSLWIPDFQSNALVNIYEGTAQTIASNLQGPWGIAPINDNLFVVTNLSGNNISLISDTGEYKEIISNLRSPTGIASDDNYVYVANTGSSRRAIEWFDKSKLSSAETAIDSSEDASSLVTGLQNVTNLILGPDNLLYFSYSLGTRGVVGRVNPEVCRTNGGCTSDTVEIVLYTELPAPLAGLTITPYMQLFIHCIFSPEIYWVQLDKTAEATATP